jgi:hypothetical protein
VEIRETIPPIQLSICGEVSFPSFGEKETGNSVIPVKNLFFSTT